MPARSLITTLSFLLWFSFTATKPLSLASASKQPVTDINGEDLVPGQKYYITSAIWGAGGGGVRPAKTGNPSSCSYSIIQESSDLRRGIPVKFHVEGTSTDKIYAGSTALEIEFVMKPNCAESSKWAVAHESGSSSSSRLVIGGPEDHPDYDLESGVFRIQVLGKNAYKLMFCPKSISFGCSSGTCYDIGRSNKEGSRMLVVREDNSGHDAFRVVFEKAESVQGKFSII